jgi:pimeloyl-ACP methyl ester carboxylesterase
MKLLHPLLLLLTITGLNLGAQSLQDSILRSRGLTASAVEDPLGGQLAFMFTKAEPTSATLVLYCQGSLPVPFFLTDDRGVFSTIPFPFDSLKTNYQFVFISKPGVPLATTIDRVNERYVFVDDTGKMPATYTDRNYLEYYVSTTNQVLEVLLAARQYERVIVMGHSQGARVAAQVAATNPQVTHLVYLSGNPLGRYDQLIREKREAQLLGLLTDEEAQAAIEALYQRWKAVHTNPEDLDTQYGDSNKTWTSFSTSTLDEFLSIDLPIFVGYGTRDIVSRYCDLLPLHFIEAGKDNLELRAYPGYDHSFYRKGPDGRVDFEDYIFPKVVGEALRWAGEE